MPDGTILDAIPFWLLYILTMAIVMLAVEAGRRLGSYRRPCSEVEKSGPVDSIIAAILGLLALLLTFTFSMAATRYETRKSLVLQEANAIGTAYLRADLLPEPQRSAARAALRDYTALRAKGAAGLNMPELLSQSVALQDRLWADATAVGGQNAGSITSVFYIQSLNQVIDLDTTRMTAGRNRIPGSIWSMLYLVSILAMTAIGYQFGLAGSRGWPEIVLLALVLATVMLLIADLDRPQAGMIQVSQQALLDVLDRMTIP
jgi:hypothetical protein